MSSKIRYEEYAGYTPKKTASQSHVDNDIYMKKFEQGFDELRHHVVADASRDDGNIVLGNEKLDVQDDTLENSHKEINGLPGHATSGWMNGPTDPLGIHYGVSDRPLTCLSTQGNIAVVGGCMYPKLYPFNS